MSTLAQLKNYQIFNEDCNNLTKLEKNFKKINSKLNLL